MAPQHAFLFDIPMRFVGAAGIAAGMAWMATVGQAPTLVPDSKDKYANGLPGAETEHGAPTTRGRSCPPLSARSLCEQSRGCVMPTSPSFVWAGWLHS